MENVYSEDDAGVSPHWLAVRLRVQGGLIPAYGDSFLCRPGAASEPGFMTDGHLPCAAICFESVIASLFCACAREAGYGDLLLILYSYMFR